jgi:hypothetical protein
MKLTRWFPDEVTPVRPGVYERELFPFEMRQVYRYAMWTGRRWKLTQATVEEAGNEHLDSVCRGRWRGLAKDPK